MSNTMNERLLFKASAIVEVLTGLALLVAPQFVIGLLLGDGLGAIGIAVARVLGIGLLSVGVAAWESPQQHCRLAPRAGLCIYNIGIAVLLVIFGTTGGMHAPLLWPVASLHGLIGAVMLWVIFPRRRNNGDR
jgi:hypothetical protein